MISVELLLILHVVSYRCEPEKEKKSANVLYFLGTVDSNVGK